MKIQLTHDATNNSLLQQLKTAFDVGNQRNAIRVCLKLLKLDRKNDELYKILATCFINIKKPIFAGLSLEKIQQKTKNEASLFNVIGNFYYAKSDFEKAMIYYEKGLAINPRYIATLINLARCYEFLKKCDVALRVIDKALNFNPTMQEKTVLLFEKGRSYILTKRYREGYAILDAAMKDGEENAFLHHEYALILMQTEAYQKAAQFLEKSVKQFPNDIKLLTLLGAAFSYLRGGYHRKTTAAFIKAFKLSSNDFNIFLKLIDALIQSDKIIIAKKLLLQGIENFPNAVEFKIRLAMIEILNNQHDVALKILKKLLKQRKSLNDIYYNLGFTYLACGNFHRGLPLYEYRLHLPAFEKIRAKFINPRWKGENLDGKTLLIISEQGLGDTLQFCRYIPLIQKGSGKIIFECQNPLIPLLKTLPNVDGILEYNQPLPKHDVSVPLLSLPYVFKTRENSIPTNFPYFQLNSNLKQKWEKFFLPYQNQFKIGISWTGSQIHQHDIRRSANPQYFKRFNQIPNVCLVSLQKNAPLLDESFHAIQLGDKFTDFSDSAACINALDLVISVDTAVVHIAGALNKPVWNLLGYYFDWRWQRERGNSPWYPSMRLFRQPKRQDWESVFNSVFEALQQVVSEKYTSR